MPKACPYVVVFTLWCCWVCWICWIACEWCTLLYNIKRSRFLLVGEPALWGYLCGLRLIWWRACSRRLRWACWFRCRWSACLLFTRVSWWCEVWDVLSLFCSLLIGAVAVVAFKRCFYVVEGVGDGNVHTSSIAVVFYVFHHVVR